MNADLQHAAQAPTPGGFGPPWVALCLAFALHVADEALTDFLSFYNPLVLSIRERVAWFPMPTFTFAVWITGLAVAVTILLLLSPFAFRGKSWMRPLSYVFAGIMLANGIAHIVASTYLGWLVPGVYSSPVLVAASLWLLVAASSGKGDATHARN